ncbi:MAG: BF3164 family lipoprotein [Rikenellaceae bacterium]
MLIKILTHQYYTDIDNIPAEMIPANDLKSLSVDSLLLAKPSIIKYYADDILLVKDVKLGELAMVIDLKLNRVSPLVKKGRSKYELLGLMDIVVLDGDVWMYNMSDSKMLKMEFDPESRTFDPGELYRFEDDRYFRVLPHCDGGFVALSPIGANSRMMLLDGDGNMLQEFGVYPQLDCLEQHVDNSVIQSIMTLSPDGKNLAIATLSMEHIGIYNSQLEENANSYGQFCKDVTYETVTRGTVSFTVQKPSYFAYENIISNADGFWVGYLGVTPTEENFESVAIRKIIEWDWRGKIKSVYQLEQPVISFDIDFESNTLYCITKELEPQIKTIKLP